MVKKRVKALMGRMSAASGLFKYLTGSTVPIIAFHRVNDRLPGNGMTCGLKKFKQFCRFFSNEFHVVPLDALVKRLKQREGVDHMLAITFDDGYIDNYEEAAPILKQFDLPATFFVTTGFIETNIVTWWDEAEGVKEPWMTWRHLSDLHHAGFEIGAHTRTHVDLGKIMGEAAWKEIAGSRQDLEDKLGIKASSFAYPYGRPGQLTEANRALVRQAGFESCCSSYGGINDGMTDVYALLRIPIGSWHTSPYEFAYEVLTGKTLCSY